MWLWLAVPAFAEEVWKDPNALVGVSVGTPNLVSVRGAMWIGDEAEVEAGVGLPDPADPFPAADLAFRWRPDFACIGCGGRVLGTFGVGVGGLVTPPPDFDGPWAFAVGPDLAANLVWWASNKWGLQVGGRVGFGPAWVGTDFDAIEVKPWAFLTLGAAF
ncbi:MAG: hypothetical protein H6734_28215 [Alphaproteobacteria bacterium]|nr:hypothetical protein [Alphaproteobacteria bacterium]